ncbi:MAG: tRNA (adenosine(37)-N6)-dimethylallyltransferase MiaA [Spirochaetaceae bacterium]|nr:tRNA (adenosine(37)-N6)-dimethylallyltransferase MiaA [Spirochaetaceae bacterium]
MSTNSSTRIPVLVLAGPTASGKTDLLLELFGGGGPQGLPAAEVVSADSMQAYRGMDIGTAKPDAALRALLPHRLVDILDPSETYSAGDFVRLADEACAEIAAAGRLPVVAGGTGFYIRNFILGLPSAPTADPAVRAAVAADLAARGIEALREELRLGDPRAYGRIHRNDEYRVCRALEVLRASGRALSDFAPPSEARSRYRFLVVALARAREELYARIDARVDAMLAAGLPAEFRGLRAAGFGPEAPGMKAIGYAEFFEAEAAGLDPLSPEGLAATAELVKRNTRRYAKRQETFFRGLPGLVSLEAAGEGRAGTAAAAAGLVRLLGDFLADFPR